MTMDTDSLERAVHDTLETMKQGGTTPLDVALRVTSQTMENRKDYTTWNQSQSI